MIILKVGTRTVSGEKGAYQCINVSTQRFVSVTFDDLPHSCSRVRFGIVRHDERCTEFDRHGSSQTFELIVQSDIDLVGSNG